MKTVKCLLKSLKGDNLKVAVHIWIFNFFFSFIVFCTLFHFISTFTGRSHGLTRGGLKYLLTHAIDLLAHNQANLALILLLGSMVVFMFVITSIFLSGGVYSILLKQEAKTFSNLVHLSIAHFFKFLKVFLLNLLNFSLAAVLIGLPLIMIWNMQKHSGNGVLFKIVLFVWIPFALLIFIYAIAAYDFSRIIALKTGKNIFFSFAKALRYLFSNKFNILLLFLLYGMVIALSHLLFSVFLSTLGNMLSTILLVLSYQIFMILKYYLKTVIMHAEVNFIISDT